MRVQEIIDIIESVAPLSIQQEWDNSGIQIGDKEADVSSVLLCTDITEDVIKEAEDKGCGMLISHHPLLFHGLKRLTGCTPQERCVMRAIRNNIIVYSAHTSMDSWLHGVSGHMAEKLGIRQYRFLLPTMDNAGLGVIGELPEPVNFNSFLSRVKDIFQVPVIRYTATPKEMVRCIAICGGAGSDFLGTAIGMNADVFVSADFKYHEFQQAVGRIAVVDIGHFESEQFTKEIFYRLLQQHAKGIQLFFAETDKSPILTY